MDLGGIFAGTFEALKRRLGLMVLISLIPTAVSMVVVLVGVLGIGAVAVGIIANPRAVVGSVVLTMVIVLAMVVVISLATFKAQGMSTLAAYQIAEGRQPSLGSVWADNRGFLPRMASLFAMLIGVFVVLYGIIAALIIAMVRSVDGRSGAAAAGAVGMIFLFVIVLIPLSLYVQTKLLYTIPALAIEELGGIASLKRSWTLTRGAFWRTLGYYLVAGIMVAVVGSVVSGISRIPLASLQFSSNSGDPAQAMAGLSLVMPLIALTSSLQLLIQLITQPFLFTYVTYMYVDQVRRTELPPAGTWGGYGQPGPQGGYYAPPNQYYGQPGQPYPPQPGAAGPQPGQGYPPAQQPGQGYQPPQPGNWQPPTPPAFPQG